MSEDAPDPALADESIDAEISTAEATQEVSQDVGMTNGEDNAPTAAAAAGPAGGKQLEEEQDEGVFEPRIPAKKDATLREFMGKMDEFAPIVRLLPFPLCLHPDIRARHARARAHLTGETLTSTTLRSQTP